MTTTHSVETASDLTTPEVNLPVHTAVATMGVREVPRIPKNLPQDDIERMYHGGNQDSAVASTWGVCIGDGVGSTKGSEVASDIATSTFAAAIDYYHEHGMGRPDGSGIVKFADMTDEDAKQMVHTAAYTTWRRLAGELERQGVPAGQTTFAAVIYMGGHRAVVFNVGDSPVLQIRDGQVRTVSDNQGTDGGVWNTFNGRHMPHMDAIHIVDVEPGDTFLAHTDGFIKDSSVRPNVTYKIDTETLVSALHEHANPQAAANHVLGLPDRLHAAKYRNPDYPGHNYWSVLDDRTVGLVTIGEA